MDEWEEVQRTNQKYTDDEKIEIKAIFNNLIDDNGDLGNILFEKNSTSF